MIPRTIPIWQAKSWQEELSELVTDPEELISLLKLCPSLLPAAQKAHSLFPLRSTRAYISRIKPGDINDPLLKQILPLAEEAVTDTRYTSDPLEEHTFTQAPGLIHKYHGRVLLIAANQCAINCRYCFRRHFDYADHKLSREQWAETFAYIKADPSIDEVILSGGDPLAVSDKQLAWMVDELESIKHITRLRIHTRIPIVAPSRIDGPLLDIFTQSRFNVVLVSHCNHAQEIDTHVAHAFSALKKAGITLLNQAVLLKGVNDNSATLIALSQALFTAGVLPYYLHVLDKVQGAMHFDITKNDARSLHNELLANLPGYLVPKLVKEVPNASSKVPII